MDRVFNFAAGPSMLPLEVLKKAQTELLSYNNTGMSVMEMSHRSAAFEEIINKAEELIRELMGIPENYSVMFLQGGASTQFAMVPLNLYKNKKADYILTGAWADKAVKEAQKYGEARVLASSKDKNFSYIPKVKDFNQDSDYVHITMNNTIYGTRYTWIPQTGKIPLVADMSSNILSEQIDVSKFGLIYAGAQKNLAPSGITLVIARKDLIENCLDITPTMLQYKIHDENKSLYNTPPCFIIYILKLVLEWLKKEGGVKTMEEKNIKKASMLYNFLDNSKLFAGTAAKEDRSLMNIPFVLPNDDLNKKFIDTAKKQGFVELKGHRSVGGMRASIYNAMPVEGVKELVEIMKKFEKENS
ncbi:MAG: 3-phosphoserine/phosphohydroxythreonine transaminase [Spirochaetaceae bacterium]|nr:3-phosphoserine/phosphohydroxythreonine transaminase [Spirochaetaceae bacterium]